MSDDDSRDAEVGSLGWTGDIAVFAPTGCSLTQSDGFLADWLLSVRDETLKDNGGVPPLVVPDVLTPGPDTVSRSSPL